MQTDFRIDVVDYTTHAGAIHRIRHTVFVEGQGIDPALERDHCDDHALHVLARTADGDPIGTARMSADGRIGRMAVLTDWRRQGIGEALLAICEEQARQRGLGELSLHAQLAAYPLYARNGFLPEGTPHDEAGIAHQPMRRRLDGAMDIRAPEAALAALTSVIHRTRRELLLMAPLLDPGFLDHPLVMKALRTLATRRSPKRIQLLIDAPTAIHHQGSPVLALIQRLPSAFVIQQRDTDTDQAPISLALNDRGDWLHRPSPVLHSGTTGLPQPAQAHRLHELFAQHWASSTPCPLFRPLAI